jgi:hypothetical protein
MFREFSKHRNETAKCPGRVISGAELDFLDTKADRLNPLNLYVHNWLYFSACRLAPFLTPPIEGFITFNQHGHQRVTRNPFGEVGMLPA